MNSVLSRPSIGDPLPQNLVDSVTGFGDAFLIPELARDALDIDGGVDKCSGWYSGGSWAGTAWGIGMSGLGLARGGFRPELGNWKQGGDWFFPKGTRGPHFHWGRRTCDCSH